MHRAGELRCFRPGDDSGGAPFHCSRGSFRKFLGFRVEMRGRAVQVSRENSIMRWM